MARATRRASLNRQSKGINNPSAPSNETLLSGVKLYRNVCAGCHGSYGHPSHWGTRNFYPRVPQFAEQSPRLTASQMFVAIKYGIRYSGMGGYDGELSEEKMWAVATLLEHLDSLPPEVKTAWMNKQ
ncbi:MAG: c-type cytochrome [Chthoniobacterales bacterium]